MVSAGCDTSSPTSASVSPTASVTGATSSGTVSATASSSPIAAVPDAATFWAMVQMDRPAVPADLSGAAVVDGFRVHPDPDEDGVIHVFTDESVAVNASDIAARPPADQSYLVMNWGDGPNQRVGCGPCRADHQYDPGRYRLTASADNIAGSEAGASRSISLEVQVSARREKPEAPPAPVSTSHFQAFGFMPDVVTRGTDGVLVLPIVFPPGVTRRFPFYSIDCDRPLTIIDRPLVPLVPFPGGVGLTYRALRRGTCVATVYGTDANGPFTETSTVTIE